MQDPLLGGSCVFMGVLFILFADRLQFAPGFANVWLAYDNEPEGV